MKYKEIDEKLDNFKRSLKDKIVCFIFAIFLTLLLVSAPAAILINLTIYRNYLKLIIFIGSLFLIFAYIMIQVIYYSALTKGEIKGIWLYSVTDSIIPAILILGIVLFIFFIGVV